MSAKKRGPGRPPKSKKGSKAKAEHLVPNGFWAQVGAILLILIAILVMLGLGGVGGAFPIGFADAARWLVGWTAWVLPFVFVWQAVQVFRSDENRLPGVIWVATILFAGFFAGLFQLMLVDPLMRDETAGGGAIGWLVASAMREFVTTPVAALILVVLILILSLFVLSVSPKAIFSAIANFFRRERDPDQVANEKIAKKLNEKDLKKVLDEEKGDPRELKLNKNVPTVDRSGKIEPESNKHDTDKGDREERGALTIASDPNWEFPPLDLLSKKQNPADPGDVQHNAEIIRDTLAEFNINVEMEDVNIGPQVTQYTLKPSAGVKLSRITNVADSLSLNLGVPQLRVEAPIPGKKSVGIEVPNLKPAGVGLHAVLGSPAWKQAKSPLTFALGLDVTGKVVIGDLNKMPHLLISGTTGSGKSVALNALLCSLLYRNSPSEMKLILIDPKQVEMVPYNDIPHLLAPVITEPEKGISALKWAVGEMTRRYSLLKENQSRNIGDYNKSRPDEIMPYIVIVMDEFADFMMLAKRDVEALVVRLAQKARAVGIHLVLAPQRPSVDVVTGLIKANVPGRMALKAAAQVDSRTMLDGNGAEVLRGNGDMLFKDPEFARPKRVQGLYVSDDEIRKITDFLRMEAPPDYNPDIISQQVQINGKGGVVMDFDGAGDGQFREAVQAVIEAGKASTSLLQRRVGIGYGKAAKYIDLMEEQGIVGPPNGSRPRDVLISNVDDLGGDGGD